MDTNFENTEVVSHPRDTSLLMLFAWRQKGWEDAREGRAFCPLYETILPEFQNAYEDGRLTFANVKMAGVNPPKWTNLLRDHGAYVEAVTRAETLVGAVIPRTREQTL